MFLDTSAGNSPINLNISIGRNGVWYPLQSFSANAGTGTVTVSGTNGTNGWSIATSGTLAGAMNITGNITLGSPLYLVNNAPGTVSGSISGGYALNISGSSTLTITSSQTYTGGTNVTGGTLLVANASALGAASGNIVASGGVLDLGGYNLTSSGTVAFTGGTVQNGALTNNTVAFNAQSGAVSASLAGNAGLTKSSTGIVTLSGSNGYSGGTTVNAGVLAIASTGALPGWNIPGKLTVNNGGAIAVGDAVDDSSVTTLLTTGTNFQAGAAIGFDTSAGDRTFAANLGDTSQGTLGLVKVGPNTLTMTGSCSYSGPTTITAGTLAFDYSGNTTLSGAINGAGNLAQTGTGTLAPAPRPRSPAR